MRVAVVTGGARRIGATIVNSLIDDGWAVIVHCNRSLTQAKQLIQRGQGAIVSGDSLSYTHLTLPTICSV